MSERTGPAGRAFEGLFLSWTALIPLMIWFHLRFAHRYTLPVADFVFLAAASAFGAGLFSGALKWRTSSWYRPLLAYAGALVLSTLASQNVRQSVPKLAGDLYLIAAAVLTVNYVTDREKLRRICLAWIAGVIITIAGTVAGLVLFFSGATTLRKNPFLSPFGSLPPGHYPRIRATFLNPNMMCSYVVAGIMILIAARQAGWLSKSFFSILLTGALVAAAFSISPGLGGLCLALGLWFAGRDRSVRRSRAFAVSGTLIAFLVSQVLLYRLPLATTSAIQAILHPQPSARFFTWMGAWHTFLAHPLFGKGLESEAANVHYVVASGALQSLTDAHNTWLSVVAQQGVVGLIAFGWVVVHLVRRFRVRVASPDQATALRTAFELAMVGGFLYATLADSFENTRHVWALMGLVAAVQQLPGLPGANVTTD